MSNYVHDKSSNNFREAVIVIQGASRACTRHAYLHQKYCSSLADIANVGIPLYAAVQLYKQCYSSVADIANLGITLYAAVQLYKRQVRCNTLEKYTVRKSVRL